MWMITGGAGYIGSHVVQHLLELGERVVVLDDLSTGVRDRIPPECLVVGTVHDSELLAAVIDEYKVEGVLHFAAKKQVAESVAQPLHYFYENVEGLRRLLRVVTEHGVGVFVFSSSAAVYGTSEEEFVAENSMCRPQSPYGETKLVGEWMLRNVARATGLRYANLRYFNVAGAGSPELADVGAFNLIPMVFERLDAGLPPRIFGDDYATPDGTCIRDFVHVSDVAAAHCRVAAGLRGGEITEITANIGRGVGSSVREILDTIADVTAHDRPWVEPVMEPRRPGDPARVVASSQELSSVLGWTAQQDVRAMIRSAWNGWKTRLASEPPRSARCTTA